MNATGRILTDAEVAFCRERGYSRGYETDARRVDIRVTHICWPYASYKGALCQTPHLWFSAEPDCWRSDPRNSGYQEEDDRVSCAACLEVLDMQRAWPSPPERLVDRQEIFRVRCTECGVPLVLGDTGQGMDTTKHGLGCRYRQGDAA